MNKSLMDLSPKSKEVIIDIVSGHSALRGSHVFAPGIMAMPFGKYIFCTLLIVTE